MEAVQWPNIFSTFSHFSENLQRGQGTVCFRDSFPIRLVMLERKTYIPAGHAMQKINSGAG
jgi:hypothetical protein